MAVAGADGPYRVESRYESLTGGSDERAERYLMAAVLHRSERELDTMPWYRHRAYREALMAALGQDGHREGPASLGDLAGLGFSVRG